MNELPDPKRIVGALRLLAEISAVGAEFAATRTVHDELTAGRRRDDTCDAAGHRLEPGDPLRTAVEAV